MFPSGAVIDKGTVIIGNGKSSTRLMDISALSPKLGNPHSAHKPWSIFRWNCMFPSAVVIDKGAVIIGNGKASSGLMDMSA